ncbi:MAG: cation:proton antiporter [Dehalococcoidia bacterium]|nr:cation:proton antiporter [Dehalococcoidia bacterium]
MDWSVLPFITGSQELFATVTQGEEIRESLLSLGLLIIVAKLAEGVFRRLHLSSILAYALTGVLLGPVLEAMGLWSIHPTGHIDLLLTLGVFVFFFLIGLDEIDIPSFVDSLRGHYFLAAVVSVLFSLSIAMLVTTDFVHDFGIGLSFNNALALAGILSMSSLGIVAKVLADEGKLRNPIGLQIFTVVVIAELITLLVIGFSIGDHVYEVSATGMLVVVAKILGFAAVCWLLSSRVLPRVVSLVQRLIRVPQLSLGLLLGSLFLMVDAAELMGLHGTLGALLMGAALSSLPYQTRQEVTPGLRGTAEGLFVPLFFASAGLHFSFTFVDVSPSTMIVLAVIPLAGNFVGAFVGAYVSRLTVPYAVASGLMGKGVAEIALLLVLRDTGAVSESLFSFLVLVMFGYLLLMPTLISFTVNHASRRLSSDARIYDVPSGVIRFPLNEVTVDDIMDRGHPHPNPSLTVIDFTEQWTIPRQHDYVIVDDDEVVGIISLSMLRYLPEDSWTTTRLREVVRSSTPVAQPEEYVEDVLQRMTENQLSAIPVVDSESGKFLGSLTSDDIVELVVDRGRL